MTTVQPTETAAPSTQAALEYVPRHAAWLADDSAAPAPTDEDTLQFHVDQPISEYRPDYAPIDTSADYVPIRAPRKSWRHRKPTPSPVSTS